MAKSRVISLDFDDAPSPTNQELLDYFSQRYNMNSVSTWEEGFVNFRCPTVPQIANRPFVIGGRAIVWQQEDVLIGRHGKLEACLEFDDDDIHEDLQPLVIPKAQTLSRILNEYFPEAIAITYLYDDLVVEFDEIPRERFEEQLEQLPCYLAHTEVDITLCLGPIYGKYPTATRPFRGWGRRVPSDLDHADGHLNATAEDWANGRVVKRVTTRLNDPDVSPISTRYVNLGGSPQVLLHSDEIRAVDELFWIEDGEGRPRLLASRGRRVVKMKVPGTEHEFIEHVQGIFLTESVEVAEDLEHNELQTDIDVCETDPVA